MRTLLLLIGLIIAISACKTDLEPDSKDPVMVEHFGPGYDTLLRHPVYTAKDLDSTAHYTLSPLELEFNASDFPKNNGLLHLQWQALDSVNVIITEYSSLCKCVELEYEKEIKELTQPKLINITFNPQNWDKGEFKYLFVYTSGFPYKHRIKLKRNQ